jgi:micrococcal nuclease
MFKKILYIFGVIIVFIIILASFGSDNSTTPPELQNIIEQNEVVVIASTTNKESVVTEPVIVIDSTTKENIITEPKAVVKSNLYSVIKVVDGDTIDVSIDGKTERLRLIGINTPETVDPRKPVECLGVEASNKAKSILTGKKVALESDPTQGERDKYNRLLRYVFLENGTNFNLLMIKEGYAYEYTYDIPYKYQIEFKTAQNNAMNAKIGLWGDVCQVNEETTVSSSNPVETDNSCTIKGNISSTKEKIYHVIGCGSYEKTVIDETAGEKWFCTEQEALDAGWRKALNCN